MTPTPQTSTVAGWLWENLLSKSWRSCKWFWKTYKPWTMIQIFRFCNDLSLSPKKYFGSKVPQINSINSILITNDNTTTASMNTSNKRPALWCRTLSPLTSAGVTGRPFWSDQSWGACPALFLLSYTLFMQVLPTSCQQGGENTASILPLLQIIPHHVKDFISHTYCFDPTSNLVSWFLPEKLKVAVVFLKVVSI